MAGGLQGRRRISVVSREVDAIFPGSAILANKQDKVAFLNPDSE